VLKTTVIDAEPTRLEVHRTWLGNDVLMRTYLEPEDMYDLVTAVHCRTEGSVAERSIEFFESLWHHCRGMLVIIEPGTEDGFAQMLAVRNHLLNLHGSAITVAAPCPHAGPCPLSAKSNATHPGDVPKDGFHHSFCHFAQRYERDRSLQKMNSIDHQKQRVMPSLRGQGMRRFSYVVLERIGDGAENDPAVETKRIQGRILREPLKRNGHVVLYLCQENGQVEQQAYTRRKHCDGTYRWARQASWGDEWPHPGVTAKPLDCDATPASA
jgi:ribosomal protein RSM22 (predicted rRNA methylase)